ncbi:hypothetical protein UY3_19155 [Chelonia mydas]|uniref:Uncharacterized protein n=1 Tax=Chelonia mydas TaxID=8469 RepID=M7AVA7_CHEMY|nr:hypothetical protein UY3_19155 [Chelonia mydas]
MPQAVQCRLVYQPKLCEKELGKIQNFFPSRNMNGTIELADKALQISKDRSVCVCKADDNSAGSRTLSGMVDSENAEQQTCSCLEYTKVVGSVGSVGRGGFNTYKQIAHGMDEKRHERDTQQCHAKIKELRQAYQKIASTECGETIKEKLEMDSQERRQELERMIKIMEDQTEIFWSLIALQSEHIQ